MKYSENRVYKITSIIITIIAVILLSAYMSNKSKHQEDDINEELTKNVSSNNNIDKSIQELFEKRNQVMLSKNTENLESIYDLENKLGQWAYEHEIRKIKYIENWSQKQGVEFKEIKPRVMIKSIKDKDDKISVYLLCSTEYKYKYNEDEEINTSRIGTYHVMDLVEEDGEIKIIKEWYDDPFADSMDLENFQDDDMSSFISSQIPNKEIDLSENRKNAVNYANRYCGAASQEQYGFKYNEEYKDYNSQGGDCTNFISQVLLEGGFEKNQAWNYNSSGASKAWVNASSFKDYLLYSSRGSLIVGGDYKNVYKSAYDLNIGDVISYEKKGKIAHTAVVTGHDSKAYPLVTCHNTDRNNVPWDLGFSGKNIKFYFIKMNY